MNFAGADLSVTAEAAGQAFKNFVDVELIGADFTGARLINARFQGSVLTDADISGANLSGACFTHPCEAGLFACNDPCNSDFAMQVFSTLTNVPVNQLRLFACIGNRLRGERPIFHPQTAEMLLGAECAVGGLAFSEETICPDDREEIVFRRCGLDLD